MTDRSGDGRPGPATLSSHYRRRPDVDAGSAWFGWFDLVVAPGQGVRWSDLVDESTHLAIWAPSLLTPSDGSGVRVVERVAGRLVVAPTDPAAMRAADRWELPGLRSRIPARHANDGPTAAYLVRADGSTIDLDVVPATAEQPPRVRAVAPVDRGDASIVPVVPHPRRAEPLPSTQGPAASGAPFALTSERFADDWAAVASLAERLGTGDPPLASRRREAGTRPCEITLDDALADDVHQLTIDGASASIVAGGRRGVRHALITLAQLAMAGSPSGLVIDDGPTFGFRGVHLDLARRWFEPGVVERLLDLAAWRKLDHVHLHLTDDEAWRLPVDGYPSLAAVGGTRGHGLAIPPVCGSRAAPYGRAYTAEEIGRWVERADRLGLTLVPEVDVPAHCGAALAAVPSLRDPDDTSNAVSAQGYVDNVLVPGHPETEPFLRAVFGAVADLFPTSPVIHIGGDEVPAGAWTGSPIARAEAARRGLSSVEQLESAFHRDLIEMIRSTTGRDVAMWEEAALGGVDPSAYAVGWTSPAAAGRLAEAGHRVVVAPGQAYYLDMASGREWERPGNTWAGTVTLGDTCAFDPLDGWPPERRDQLLGVQACLWGEHVEDLDVLDALAFPRLDAVAERAWTGRIVGGPDDLAARARRLPRFTR